MKSATFYEKHSLKIEDKPICHPKSDEVLIKVRACGICGTDVHIFNGDEGAAPTPRGTTLGHEFSGIVEAIGSSVTSVKVGDRVCVDPNKLCGSCYFCKNGVGHFCENMVGIGTTVDGGFAEYCTVPESQVYKFSDKISFEEAAMTEPLACCLHGIDLCHISCSDTVLVIGGGMIGMLMLQLARLSGASTLIMVEPVLEKRKIALSLGADIVIDPINEDVKAVLAQNGIYNVNVVIECVGRTETMKNAISYAGNKALVMLFGLTAPGDEISIKPYEIFKKELTLTASFINPYTQKRALSLIESGKIDVSSMVYRLAELDELPEILSDSKERSKGKIIISFK